MNPIENSTLASANIKTDSESSDVSSMTTPSSKLYTYNINHKISLDKNNFIVSVVFKKNKTHENQNKSNQTFNIDDITIIL